VATEPPGVCLLVVITAAAFIAWWIFTTVTWSIGPRWLLASGLVLIACVLIQFGGAVWVLAIQPRKRWNHYLGAAICVGMVGAMLIGLPQQIQDAFGPLEAETVTIVASSVSSNGTVEVRLADGRILSYANAFGIVDYVRPTPGRYLLTETHLFRRVVDARPVN
jgi:hypothetical protein